MATFPATLPAPLAAGYNITPVDTVVRTDMEVGTQKSRRVSYSRQDKIKVGWLLNGSQCATFRDWFDASSGANGGQAWFDIILNSGGGTGTVQARFSGVPQIDFAKPFWAVTATLEVMYA